GDVVVALNPWRPDELICKRITAVEGEKIPAGCRDLHKTSVIPRGHVWLEGDNRLSSYDSRDHGSYPSSLGTGESLVQGLSVFRERADKMTEKSLIHQIICSVF
ncbi:Mitochondrial inner membrane protease subunit 1, partial [Geodia barretti]